jgi:protein SCO1/2
MSAPPIRATYCLVDHDGTPVTERTHRGRWQLVQFGFTSCKVVCPRALAKLGHALDELEREIGPAPLVALYITVDPDRDSPAVMKEFLESSHPRFRGLTGTAEQIEDAKRAFKVFTRRRDAPDGYDVQHTAITYLLDPDGRPAHHWPDTHDHDVITRDLVRHLDRPDRPPGSVAQVAVES